QRLGIRSVESEEHPWRGRLTFNRSCIGSLDLDRFAEAENAAGWRYPAFVIERLSERIAVNAWPQHPAGSGIPEEIQPALVDPQRDFEPAVPLADDFAAVVIDWRGAFEHDLLPIGIERRVIDPRRLIEPRLPALATNGERLGRARRARGHQQ